MGKISVLDDYPTLLPPPAPLYADTGHGGTRMNRITWIDRAASGDESAFRELVTRHRAFYMIDRSIPVAFEPGENHNVDRAILLRRFIE